MKEKILLISPKITKGAKSHFPLYSEYLGLSYLAGELNKNGFDAQIIDCDVTDQNNKDIIRLARSLDDLVLVGISGMSSPTFPQTIELASALKESGVKAHITSGGHFATNAHFEIMERFGSIDSIIRGEGELTIVELAKSLINNSKLSSIDGLTYRCGKEIIVNPNKDPLSDLNSLAFPKRYNTKNILLADQKIPLVSSRGCYGSCSFCTLAFFSKKWRARSAQDVVDELQELNEIYGARRFRFVDENYFGHCKDGLQRAVEISEEIIKRGLNITYKVLSRADDLDESVLIKMIESGLTKLSIGVESYNQRQLDFYNKKITPNDIVKTIELLKKLNLGANFSFIMFDPYVIPDELETNLNFMRQYPQYFEPRRLRSKLRPDLKTPITGRLMKDGLVDKKGFFEYETRFADGRTQIIWNIIQGYNQRYDEVEEELFKVQETYFALIARRNRLGSGKARNEYIEHQYNNATTDIFNLWADVLEFAIDYSRKYPSIDDKRIFPSMITNRFDKIHYRLKNLQEVIQENENCNTG